MDDLRRTLAQLIDELYDDYEPFYNKEGQCIGSNIADAVAEKLTSDRSSACAAGRSHAE